MDEKSKDPAFLFYSSDFLIDTLLWGDIDVGRWIKLMCYLHQKGHLLYEQVLDIIKDENSIIFSKLKIDEKGLYYNERLDFEIAKRKAYSDSRRRNRKNISKTYVEHMVNEIVIENINIYISNNNYSNELKDMIISWLDYKVERKESYKEKGFKSLLTQIKNNIDKFTEAEVINLINDCMASNYKGIIFDKLKTKKYVPKNNAQVPEWFDKKIVGDKLTPKELKEMDELMEEFKD